MSVRLIEKRWCDVCERDYDERPDWMILSAANAPAEADAQWDFCSMACLTKWVTEDEPDDAGPDFGTEHDTARAAAQTETFHVEQPDGTSPPPTEAPRVHQRPEPPRQTLSDFIMSGGADEAMRRARRGQ